MITRLKYSAESMAELHALPDDALLKSAEAGAFLNMSPSSLNWYRCQRIGPDWIKVGSKSVRYRVGALRAYIKSLPPGLGRPKKGG